MNPLSTIFAGVLAASWAVSWLILAVIAARWIGARRVPARWRFAAWLVLAVALLVPFRFPLRLRARETAVPPSGLASAAMLMTTAPLPSAPAAASRLRPADSPVSVSPAGHALTLQDAAALLWAAGAVGLGLLRAAASGRFRRSLKEAKPVAPELREMAEREALRLGLRSSPELVTSEAVSEPVLFGLWRPRLVFPPGLAERLSGPELRFVVLHELGHCRRRDLAAQTLLQIAAIVHWFNPLAWLAAHLARLDCELACDEFVLRQTRPEHRGDYGTALLAVLEMTARRENRAPGLTILNARRDLHHRIRAIANYGRAPRWSTVAGAVALALLTTAAGTRLAWAQPAVEAAKAADDPAPKKLTVRGVSFVVVRPETWVASPSNDLHDLNLPMSEVTHLAFVVDTSKSMRDALTGLERQMVLAMFDRLLKATPRLQFFQLFDADGRSILREFEPGKPWIPANSDELAAARESIRNYQTETVSDPTPGILRAYRRMHDFSEPRAHFGIWVLGDEMTTRISDEAVIERLTKAAPGIPPGQPRIALSAVNFSAGGPFGANNSQKRYEALMEELARNSGGTVVTVAAPPASVPDNAPPARIARTSASGTGRVQPSAEVDERALQARAYQQDVAEKKRRDAIAAKEREEKIAALDGASAFAVLEKAAEQLAAEGQFSAAARVHNRAMELKPADLPMPEDVRQLLQTLRAQTTPAEVTIHSDGKTWIWIRDFRFLTPLETQTMRVLPGNYEVIGRRTGYQDVHLALVVRNGAPPPSLEVICTEPAESSPGAAPANPPSPDGNGRSGL